MLFQSVAPSTLTMQFGSDDPIVIEPGECANVPDHWVGLVKERAYLVEQFAGDAETLEAVQQAGESSKRSRASRKKPTEGESAG